MGGRSNLQLKNSVPRADMDKLQADHGSLLRRHQELVVLHSNASTQVTEVKTLRTELLSVQTELDTTKTDLIAADSKAKKNQELLNAIETRAVEDYDANSLWRKVGDLEKNPREELIQP